MNRISMLRAPRLSRLLAPLVLVGLLFTACDNGSRPVGPCLLPGGLPPIAVMPNPVTLAIGGTQQFVAIGQDANGNVVSITPTWSVVAGGGTIDAGSGVFTAGTVPGTFLNTVKATSGSISNTATVIVNPAPVALGSATNFAVLAGAGVSNTGVTTVTGDLGTSPTLTVTGFPPGTVTGTIYADATAAAAQVDLTTAFDDARDRPNAFVMGTGELGGRVLYPGLYKAPAGSFANIIDSHTQRPG